MCEYGEHRVKAQAYLSAAKKRNKHLKKLKSVSRAYRKAEVRGLKALAHEAQQRHEAELVMKEDEYRQREAFLAATSQSMVNRQYNGLLGAPFQSRPKWGGLFR
jgi:hypothetical protein